MVKPEKTFFSVSCSERESASPATETSATREAEGMPSLSATITAVSSQSAAFTQERTKFLSAPSSRLLARALEARRVMRRIATKQMTNTMQRHQRDAADRNREQPAEQAGPRAVRGGGEDGVENAHIRVTPLFCVYVYELRAEL